MKLAYRSLIAIILLFFVSQVFTEDRPGVEFFSPQGTVKNVRQVTARFTDQMVPFGDPRAQAEPFEIDCAEKGTGRWADGRNWIFDFDCDLPAGVKCTFRLRPGLKTLAGKEIKGEREFSFSTGGPVVTQTLPYEGSSGIAEDQVFILTLDAEPDMESLKKNAYFSVEGIQDRPGVRIIEGKDRIDILNSQYGRWKENDRQIVLVQCRQNFPSKAQVSLVWGKGVQSKSGVATDQDQVLRFKSREPFSVNFSCERENADADCIPILPMGLYFTNDIPVEQAGKIVLKGKDGKTWKPALTDDDRERKTVSSVVFNGPFPPKSAFTIDIPRGLKDDDGRLLVNADIFPLALRTEKYPPLAKFAARFGILELNADPALPVTLRNIEPEVKARMLQVGNDKGIIQSVVGKIFSVSSGKENIQEWLRKVGNADREESILTMTTGASGFSIPKKQGAQAFEVVGIPLKEPGLYIVEIESGILGASLLGKNEPMYVHAAALVTNLSAHFKWGRESSLVWVTTLDTGDPVAGAEVAIKDCNEKILWQGKTDARGIARIQGPIPGSDNLPSCGYSSIGSGLFITAKLGKDMTFVYSSWNDGIEPWRFQLPVDYYSDPTVARTVLDRTLLRAGETVHMKHFIRNHTMGGFTIPPANKLPDTLEIVHAGSEEKWHAPLKWDAGGSAHTFFAIPKDAKLGLYLLNFVRGSSGKERDYDDAIFGGDFRVEEFRVPLLRGTIKPPSGPLVNAAGFPLDISIRYLSGGGAGELPVRLRSEIRDKEVPSFEGYEDFAFCKGAVREGITRGGQDIDDEDDDGDSTESGRRGRISSVDLRLDKTGGARVQVPDIPRSENPREALTEIEFRDPNGELQTVSAKVPLWPSERMIGIKPDSWALSKDKFRFHAAVLDLDGRPVGNAPVRVKLLVRKSYAHRKRLVGGFYAYEYTTEIRKIADLAGGNTDARGMFICEASSPESGNIILQAESEDRNGNRTVTNTEVWVAGGGDWWFEVSDNDRIDLLPEKRRYEPGETAVFQVRMPFRSATALVTVEREGVMESWISKLSGKEPVIKVPVRGTYAPNCFVSALVVRGRVSGVQPTALVDMGRPAYKLGISEIRVGWRAHELKVGVEPDRRVYTVRDRANVRIKVRTADGGIPPQNTEIAMAAVDEGLLELMPNKSWDLLSGMMDQRPYEVNTSTAQMQVVGRRHFGLKALPQGGGGGRQTTRELFDTLLLWKGKVVLDRNGEAQVVIPLNDSITSFRIVAVASGGAGLFGTGRASIQSTQDLMVLAGLPPLVREGDRFRAGFTLRNTTDRAMDVEASVKAEGIPAALSPVSAALQPGEAREIGWDIVVPYGIEKISWQVDAADRQSGKKDSIRTSQKVTAAVPVRTFQATIAQVERDYRASVEMPGDAVPGRGGVKVGLKPRISQGQTGIAEYMGSYPYTCMEQRVSIAVSLRDKSLWDKAMSDLSPCMDSDGLVKYFPTCDYGSPVLTSYLLALGHEAGWVVPEDRKNEMIGALTKFVEGGITRYTPLQTADLTLRKLTAIEALSRYGAAQAKLLDSITVDPNLWPTSAVIDWFNIVHNMGDIPDRDRRMKEAEQILRSRLNFQGTRMNFSTEGSDGLWWLMVSNDVNCVRLLLSLLRADKWKEDIPRILIGALQRQRQGRWDLTVANAWGVLALEKFSGRFESVPMSGDTSVALAGESKTASWTASPGGTDMQMAWPAKKGELVISHRGKGKPWATISSRAAIPLKEPLSSGYRIKKTITPVEQKNSGKWSAGDVYRVRLEIEAQADQTWIVVNDPVPAGVTVLGSGLARDSQLLAAGEQSRGWIYPVFQERSFEAFRAYYEYVPKGKFTVEYSIRINQDGRFNLPATRVEALYSPEMFGELPNQAVEFGQ